VPSSTASPPEFDLPLFERWFTEVSAIGATADGGVHRPFGSQADRDLRLWLSQTAEQLGLTVRVDAIGNIWATLAGDDDLPALVVGSHHDSVPFGGRFDGPLGVLAGLAVAAALTRAGLRLRHPFAVVSFTAEEPNPFGLSTLGSRTVAGRLTQKALAAAQDSAGRSLESAVAAVGGDLQRAHEARLGANDIAAFLELHIEQGLRLLQADIPVGVVSGICGIYRERITVRGEANHAGTTRLSERHDALLAGAEIALAVEAAVAAADREDVIGTVGVFTIEPSAINIIPGVCELVAELRAGNSHVLTTLLADLTARIDAIAKSRGVQIERTVLLDQAAAPLAEDLRQTLTEAARTLDIPTRELFSMAGHDATHVASFTRAAMLFVPSIGGKSHCPEELSRTDDIACALRVLIETVQRLDRQLDVAQNDHQKG